MAYSVLIALPCPVCRDGEVEIGVHVEPPVMGELAHAQADAGEIACGDGCELGGVVIDNLCKRASERALEGY